MSLIDYDNLVQKSLRNVIRTVLENAEKSGIPEKHEFVITFIPNHDGVVCPKYLLEQYKEEITIVLRDDEFRDLVVTDNYFKVTLYINDKIERLVVPFDAMICFGDPYAKFGLHFDSEDKTKKVEAASGVEDSEPKNNVIDLETFRKRRG